MLNSTLTERGYEVIEAQDGRQGLELAISQHPDLILLDIKMPVMDGIGMLKELRKVEGGRHTKVIMLTNLEPDDKIIGEMVEDQPSYYIVKSDIQFMDLLEKIKELLVE